MASIWQTPQGRAQLKAYYEDSASYDSLIVPVIDPKIERYYAEDVPFLTVLTQIKRNLEKAPALGTFNWLDDEDITVSGTISSGPSASGATLTIPKTTYVRPGQYIRLAANGVGEEVVKVLGIQGASGDNITVLISRGQLGTSALDFSGALEITYNVMAYSAGEGWVSVQAPASGTPTAHTNAMGKFADKIGEWSLEAQDADTFANILANKLEEAERRFLMQINNTLLLSPSYQVGSTTEPAIPAGLLSFITNRTWISGTPTLEDLLEAFSIFLRQYPYVNTEYVIFTSQVGSEMLAKVLYNKVSSNFQARLDEKWSEVLGFDVPTIHVPGYNKRVRVVVDPALDSHLALVNVSGTYKGKPGQFLLMVDINRISRVYYPVEQRADGKVYKSDLALFQIKDESRSDIKQRLLTYNAISYQSIKVKLPQVHGLFAWETQPTYT